VSIIVGLDGSDTSLEALRWAAGEARRRETDLVLVYSYVPPSWQSPLATAGSDEETMDREAQRSAGRRLAELADDNAALLEGVQVRHVTVPERQPARALLETAGPQDTIVVGSRGLGGFSGLLLGSVSQHVLHHAQGPVIVVRGART